VAIQGGEHVDVRAIDAERADALMDDGHIALRAERSLEGPWMSAPTSLIRTPPQ
jgi:hypothetical protein